MRTEGQVIPNSETMVEDGEVIDPLVHPLGLHMAQIFLSNHVSVNPAHLLASLQRRCGDSVELVGDGTSRELIFAHTDHITEYAEGSIPAQTVVWQSENPQSLPMTQWEEDLMQTYDWDRKVAQREAERHTDILLVTDLMASGLPPLERIRLFHSALLAVLDVVGENALVIRWLRAQRLINPAAYQSMNLDQPTDLMGFATNIRMFRVEGRAPGETVMDTMGMSAFGLPDLQCHFTGLHPADVAPLLYNIAFYLFENGDIIEDGNTIPGIGDPNAQWVCQHEMALIGPKRPVLDIYPSVPYAAGERSIA